MKKFYYLKLSFLLYLVCCLASCGNDSEAIYDSSKPFVGYWKGKKPNYVIFDINGYCFFSTNSFGKWLYNPEKGALSITSYSGSESYLWTIATSSKSSWTGTKSTGESQGYYRMTTKDAALSGIFSASTWESGYGSPLVLDLLAFVPKNHTNASIVPDIDCIIYSIEKGHSLQDRYIRFELAGEKNIEVNSSSIQLEYFIKDDDIDIVTGTAIIKNIHDFKNMKMTLSGFDKEYYVKPRLLR